MSEFLLRKLGKKRGRRNLPKLAEQEARPAGHVPVGGAYFLKVLGRGYGGTLFQKGLPHSPFFICSLFRILKQKSPRLKTPRGRKISRYHPGCRIETATLLSSIKLAAMVTGQAGVAYLFQPLCSGVRLFLPFTPACTVRRLSVVSWEGKLIPSSHLKKLYYTIS